MPIYTRRGDKGETDLFSGQRVPKDDAFMHALGTVDECNSVIGMAISEIPQKKEFEKIREELVTIQHALFDLGASLATPRHQASEAKLKKTRFGHEATTRLETWMDEMDAQLDPLHTFILPGGHPAAAHLHMARNVCRRAERHTIILQNHGAIDKEVFIYLNRLSDYLFVTTRLINKLTNTPETHWKHMEQ